MIEGLQLLHRAMLDFHREGGRVNLIESLGDLRAAAIFVSAECLTLEEQDIVQLRIVHRLAQFRQSEEDLA